MPMEGRVILGCRNPIISLISVVGSDVQVPFVCGSCNKSQTKSHYESHALSTNIMVVVGSDAYVGRLMSNSA